MRRTDNYASNQIKLLLGELTSSSHNDKKKAIVTFQTYVQTYQPEIADETVDFLFTGCLNGKLGTGLLFWGGATSGSGANAHLKRICRHVVQLIRWLVTHESESERGNFYYTRFIRLQLMDLKQLNIPRHVAENKKKKKKPNEVDENENVFILTAILLNKHRNAQGKIAKLDIDELLLFDDEAHLQYNEWVNSGAIEQIPNYLGDKHREEIIDRPARWDEVIFKCIPLQEGEEDTTEVEEEKDVIPPIPDPLGISSVDLRSIQASYAQGRLMKSQTGQLARRSSTAVMPIEGAAPTGARKTSFRSSTTFVPYINDNDDSDNDDSDEDDLVGDNTNNNSDRVSANTRSNAETMRPGFGAADNNDSGDVEDPRGTLVKARSASTVAREKKIIASVVPSDKNFSTTLFLTLVHGSVSFNQLRAGQDHLQQHLMLQSSRRENLVRLHFGLFVQCAEGLEFLKAYRKGVLKGNEMRNRRGSNARKSIANAEEMKNKSNRGNNNKETGTGDGKDKPIAISSADKGLERLRRSQTTLDAAKVEAQRTLAPILERMKQSRRIKSAEKVLKRMTAILEYPMRMRTALEKGDLSEVVAIYQRVQAVPTSSSSLRIMHKIKEAASLVITDLKKQCYTVLLSPTANYTTLLRYGKIMSDLDGEGAYLELLRQCMIRQILHFVESVKNIRDKFCADCADANDKGLEQNLLRRSPFLAGNSLLNQDNRESIGTLVRRHADANTSRRRLNSKHLGSDGGGSDGGNRSRTQSESLVGGAWGDSDAMDFRETNRDEFALDQEDSDRDWLDEDDDGEDDFIDGNMDDLDFLDDIASSSPGNSGRNGNNRKSLKFEGLEGDSVDDDDDNSNARAAVRRGSADINHSVLLCALVRQGYVEAMVDLLAKWFPCMFRLVATLANANTGSTVSHAPPPVPLLRNTSSKPTATSNAQANSALAAKSPVPATYVNLNRGAIAPARILGAALKVYSDHVKQVISGVESSFSTLTLPSELNSAFNEVDTYVSALHYPIASVAPVVMNLTSALRYDNKMYDAIASSILVNPLREPFHRDALQEVYDLYNAMEFIMKREAAVVASNLLASSGTTAVNGTAVGVNGIAGSNAGVSRVPFGASTAGGKNNTLNFLSPTSPYYDAMNTLQALSKEGEMALAQKIMDRLMELSAALHTYMVGDIEQHRAVLMGNGGYAGYGLARLGTSTVKSDKNNLSTQSVTGLASPGKTRRRGSMMLEEELNAVVAQNNMNNKNNSAGNANNGGAAAGNKVGMENNVSELSDLIMRCLKSLRQKVKREEWVAVVVQEGVQKVFTSFAEALRRESLRVSEGSANSGGSGGGGGVGGTRGRNSISNGVPQQRGRRSGAGNLRSSIGNGLVIETLEEELRFGDADSYKACVQLDLLRACVALRCNCVPYIGNEMKLVFAVTEGRDKNQNQPVKDTQGSIAHALATLNLNDANARGGDKADKAPLNRTKSSLMTKLFQTDTKEDHTPPPPAGLIDSPNRPLSLSQAQSNNNSAKNKKLALIDMLKMSIKSNQVDVFQQNLREIIAIEDNAAGTYISLKTKEIRTTIFAGYALLVHSEEHSMWVPLPGGGATARVPVHLVRVLLSLGNERKKLAESLGELKVLRGYNAAPEGELQIEAVQAPVPTPAPATRSLFSSVEPDSGSESDSGHPANNAADDAKNTARRAYCEALLYRDYLYKQLCVGLLQNYQDLIKRLRTNTFHAAVTETPSTTAGAALSIPQRRMNNREMFASLTEVENETESSEDEAGGVRIAKMPFCLGQAVEEYNYLKSLLTPLLDNDPAVSYQETLSALERARHQAQDKLVQRYCGKQFASTTQLTQSGRMYAMMINGKNFM